MYRTENGQPEWLAPRDDINSPDLYIPCTFVQSVSTDKCAQVVVVMALVTYILLFALRSGLNSKFHPEILGVTASKAFAVVLLDFMFVKGGCYFLNIQVRISLAYSCLPSQCCILGSKPDSGPISIRRVQIRWVRCASSMKLRCTLLMDLASSVIVTLLAGMLNVGTTLYVVIFGYCFAAMALFIVRSCSLPCLPSDTSHPSHSTVTFPPRTRPSRCILNTNTC